MLFIQFMDIKHISGCNYIRVIRIATLAGNIMINGKYENTNRSPR